MNYTELDHLQGKEPIVTSLYEKLLEEFHRFGPIRGEAHKTSIHVLNRYAFAGIYTRKNYINLEFHLARRLDSKRIAKIEQGSANRFHHRLRLDSLSDIDRELLEWLKEAYVLKG